MSEQKVGSARAYRERLAKPVELPSGAVWLMRRPRLDLWLSSGRIPQSLLGDAMEAWKELPDGQTALSDDFAQKVGERVLEKDEETAELFVLMRELVRDAVVKPRIVENADPGSDDEIDPSEIEFDDFLFVVNWITKGAPVKTVTGEVPAEGLAKFSPGRGRTPPRVRKSVREVRAKAKQDVGNS